MTEPYKNAGTAEKVEQRDRHQKQNYLQHLPTRRDARNMSLALESPRRKCKDHLPKIIQGTKQFAKWDFGERRHFAGGKCLHGPNPLAKHGSLVKVYTRCTYIDDIIWLDILRMRWYDMIWYDMIVMIGYDMIWYSMLCFDLIQYNII